MPAYNEQDNIEKSVERLNSYARAHFKSYEIIVVDDGSTDGTAARLNAIKKRYRKLNILPNRRNRGYGAAVRRGLQAARGELVFFTDSDRQFDIRELGLFIKKINTCDAVVGYRRRRSEGMGRALNAWGWKWVCRLLLGIKFRDIDCAFKLMKRSYLAKLKIKSAGAAFSAELLFRLQQAGAKIHELPVKHFKRQSGQPTGANWRVIRRGFAEIYRLYLSQKNLVRSRSFYVYLIALILLFASRFVFASYSADFFDANQYMWRSLDQKLLNAMATGHPPHHPLYLFFSWIINFLSGGKSAVYGPTLVSVILGPVGIVFLYLTLRRLFSNKIAWLATIIYALVPFVFISQISILVDPTMHAFYFSALYFFTRALQTAKVKKYSLCLALSALFFALAAFAHTQVAFYLSGFIAVCVLEIKNISRENLKKLAIAAIMFVIFGAAIIGLYVKILIYGNQLVDIGLNSAIPALRYLLLGNINDKGPIEPLVTVKYLAMTMTLPLLACAVCGFIKMLYRQNFRMFFALLIWLLPAFLVSTYIYENLHGRALILSFVPLAVAASYFILQKRLIVTALLIAVVLLQLLFVTYPAALQYKNHPSANEELAQIVSHLNQDGVLVTINTTKTWFYYGGEYLSFGDVGFGAGTAFEKINEAIQDGRSAYVSYSALIYPYRRYDGAYYDIRSTGVGAPAEHSSMLSDILQHFSLHPVAFTPHFQEGIFEVKGDETVDLEAVYDLADNHDIYFGKILDEDKPVQALAVNLFSAHYKSDASDLGANDWGFDLYRRIFRSDRPVSWGYTDRYGNFTVLGHIGDDFRIILGPSPTNTASDNSAGFFYKGESVVAGLSHIGHYESLNKLNDANNSHAGSYLIRLRSGEFDLYRLEFNLDKTDIIEAENMPGEFAQESRNASFSGGRAVCSSSGAIYLISGPYKTLPQGNYRITFMVKKPDGGKSNAVDFEVISGGETFARQSLKTDEIDNDHPVTLEFNLDNTTEKIEFRARVNEGTNICLDYLKIEKLK